MEYIFVVYAFIMGAVMSSFITLVGYRVPKGISIVRPGSRCSSCGENLKHLDLIPIVSCLLSGGKCRYCGNTYGSFHMWLEMFVGVMFSLTTFLFWGDIWLIVGIMLLTILVNLNIVTKKIYGRYLKGVNICLLLPFMVVYFLQGEVIILIAYVLLFLLVVFDK